MTMLIRADASSQIGTGHVMRCLALAQVWRDMGGQVAFVTRETLSSTLKQRLLAEDITIYTLPVTISNHEDALKTICFAKETTASVVVVDGYQFDAAYQNTLKVSGLRLLFLDDYGHSNHYFSDWVLNQNIYATGELYANREAYTRLLLGTRYLLLRREFQEWSSWTRAIPESVGKVLVTMGGSDPDNVTSRVVEALNQIDMESMEITVVIGNSNPYLKQVQTSIQQSHHKVYLKENVSNMPELMAWADMAIASSGSTAWELVFMGLPAIFLPIVDNQKPIAAMLGEMSIALNSTIDDLIQQFKSLALNRQKRAEMSYYQQFLVDGKGAQRICRLIHEQNAPITIRPATMGDASLIWRWSNDPVTRNNSFNKKPILWSEHVDWYQKKLNSKDCRIWLLEQNGIPVAQIRYDRLDHNRAQISYMVDPDQRAKGFGTKILQMTSLLACEELAVTILEGEMFAHNTGSIKAFEKAGFAKIDTRTSSDQSVIVFQIEMK
jgi:UDP-2,4-diacetamido-2,4,6-trideoxy-beta-L-altropyranose hydrolase